MSRPAASVLNQKFATWHRVLPGHCNGRSARWSKDVIGGFGPSERFGIGVVSFDEQGDVRSEGGYAAIDAAPDLLIREEREEALDLVEP